MNMTISIVTHGVCESPVLVAACGFDRNDEAGALEYINTGLKAWIKKGEEYAAQVGGVFELDGTPLAFKSLKYDELFASANSGEQIILFAIDEATKQSWFETPDKVYEYTIILKQKDGTITKEVLVAVDYDHAHEEASYECEGEIIAVERGEFLYNA